MRSADWLPPYSLELARCYAMDVKSLFAWILNLLLFAVGAVAQTPLTISDKENLPSASLWEPYRHTLEASGGVQPHHWSLLSGSLPRGLELHDDGEISGKTDESGKFEITLLARDSNSPPEQVKNKFVLSVETPFTAEWDHKTRVNGERIDGSVKVSNRTGRDFDLTFVVLAVNEIGRATAIGYQHFPLKKDSRDFNIPFGDSVSRGMYSVNVDLVAEEPVSGRIFRARLVTEKQQITQGP